MPILHTISRPLLKITKLEIWKPLLNRDFRMLWFSETLSFLGDRIHFIAIIWLTYEVFESGFAMATVLAVSSIPRSVFMLVGGAISDWWSPKKIALYANLTRAVLLVVFIFLINTEVVSLGMLYVFAVIFGFIGALSYPAFMSLIPMTTNRKNLEAANGLMQGSSRFCGMVGPAIAGLIVATYGASVAFSIDAATFAIGAAALSLIRVSRQKTECINKDEVRTVRAVFRDIRTGILFVWRDPFLRAVLLVIVVVNFSMNGPFIIGLATLSNTVFDSGALNFGILLAAYSGSGLAGMFIAGSVKRFKSRSIILFAVPAMVGLGMISLGLNHHVVFFLLVIAFMGMVMAYGNVVVFAWIQRVVPSDIIGRVMSLIMVASVGLEPISYAIAGMFVDQHVNLVFVVSGAMIASIAVILLANGTIMSLYKAEQEVTVDPSD